MNNLGPYQDIVEISHAHGGPKAFMELVETTGFVKGVAYGQKRMYSIAGGTFVVGTVLGAVAIKGVTKLKEHRQRKKQKGASIKIECNDLGENFQVEFSCTGSAIQNASASKEVAA